MADKEFSEDYNQLADTFVRSVHSAATFKAIVDLCVGYFSTCGVTMSSYHHLPPVGAEDHTPAITVFSLGFPNSWVQKYRDENLHLINPVPKYALMKSEPFWWSEAHKFEGIKPEEQKYLQMLRDADFGDGLAIPVFGPNGRNAYVGLGFGRYDVEISALKVSRLQSAAQLGHQRYCRLLGDKKKEEVNLSDREREILQWVVRGKSNSVIADIIGISSYTVDTYLRRIFAKLGVSNRVTAALRGLAIGVVT